MTPEVRPPSSTPENAGSESVAHQPMDFSEVRKLDNERRAKKREKKSGGKWLHDGGLSDTTSADVLSMTKDQLAAFVKKNKGIPKVNNKEKARQARVEAAKDAVELNAARERHEATVVFTNEEQLPTHRREFHSARVVEDIEINQERKKKEPEEMVEV